MIRIGNREVKRSKLESSAMRGLMPLGALHRGAKLEKSRKGFNCHGVGTYERMLGLYTTRDFSFGGKKH